MVNILSGYRVIGRCSKAGKGGVVIAAKKGCFSSFLDISSSDNKNIIVGRIKIGSQVIRIILGYAPQETENVDDTEEFFEDMAVEVQKCLRMNESMIILGDFNAKIDETIECDKVVIRPLSRNGGIMKDLLIEPYRLNVLNFSPKCSGKWTHVIRTTEEKSVLDYVMVDNSLEMKVTDLIIDEPTLYCPFRTKSENKVRRTVYSDHNAMILKMKITKDNKSKTGAPELKKWKVTTKGVSLLTEEIKKSCSNKSLDKEISSQENYDRFEKTLHSVLDKCFHKTSSSRTKRETISPQYEELSRKINHFSRKGKVQRKVAQKYRLKILKLNEEKASEKKAETFKVILNQLTEKEKFSAQGFHKLHKALTGKSPLCTSIINDKGQEVFGEEGIKEVYRSEFYQRLKSRDIDHDLRRLQALTELLCHLLTTECSQIAEEDFNMDELDVVIEKLKKGGACGPDNIPPEIFIEGGMPLKLYLLDILNNIKNSQKIPSQWNEVCITTIYKNKGVKKLLENHRGIFLTVIASKVFERLIMERIRVYTENMSKLQAGSKQKRSPADQTFMLRSAITHARYLNIPLYLTFYDFKQCFDNLWLEDALLSLWRVGVKSEMLTLIKKLNDTSVVSVKTPLGITEKFTLPSICKQGTVLMPPICSVSVGECCEEINQGVSALVVP